MRGKVQTTVLRFCKENLSSETEGRVTRKRRAQPTIQDTRVDSTQERLVDESSFPTNAIICQDVVIAAQWRSQPQRNHHCVADLSDRTRISEGGRIDRRSQVTKERMGHRNSHSLVEHNSRCCDFTYVLCESTVSHGSSWFMYVLRP
ncbi:hypothetical protein EVAR_11274_1 [Eumeta japonica]|uniref:Uncharacterized protein n=1 Tax=Eumeta variegata TaxID=151549 RepID=A0A4C1UKQ9_EUMVA|nr:hypothetical protein EVAR_11274_1 [Eumeta japonica]